VKTQRIGKNRGSTEESYHGWLIRHTGSALGQKNSERDTFRSQKKNWGVPNAARGECRKIWYEKFNLKHPNSKGGCGRGVIGLELQFESTNFWGGGERTTATKKNLACQQGTSRVHCKKQSRM